MPMTTHDYLGYVFTISERAGTPPYGVHFADVPEIITNGATLAEAFANACEALELHLDSLQRLGLPRPEPRHRLTVEPIGLVK
ncbi:MAG: type II toxin-antitoxin system HicB family antitoxin [Isosphaeraceae bacterium]